ncbi:MAG: NAD(P)H-hydrate dehydratase [Ruminococcaceae bacterium]|nr:NAD(P)H-hydrate dehydratase [Oscillospiraceae bacterium]
MLGIDMVEIARMARALEDPSFLPRFFTTKEVEYITSRKRPEEAAAGFFAAKEALSKALGTGVRGFGLKDISVTHTPLGKPTIRTTFPLPGEAEVSITHDGGMAIAAVIITIPAQKKAFDQAILPSIGQAEEVISPSLAASLIPKRKKEFHKGDCGKVYAVAGSAGLTGAGILAARAALACGSGLITVGCSQSLNPIFEVALTEVMTHPLADMEGTLDTACIPALLEKAHTADAVLFGGGLSRADSIPVILDRVLKEVSAPLVLDADGINALGTHIDKLQGRTTVLTPHVAEFCRMTGETTAQVLANPCQCAQNLAAQSGAVVVLKSHRTVIAAPDGRVMKNVLGNPGMATGGSGDVLAGVILSLLGQGCTPFDAAVLGVYLHSLAGDMAALDKGEYGLTPTDLVGQLPYAMHYLNQYTIR